MIELTAADGNTLSAYRADPSDTPKGAVVVLQEVFGIDPHIKKVTENFAAQGYVAIAPALFDRVKKNVELGYDEAGLAAGLELKNQVETTDAIADIQAAVNSVKDTGKVAIVGYCWGGYLAYLAANKVNGLACAIGYYGGGITELTPGEAENPDFGSFQRGGSADPLRRCRPLPGLPAGCQRFLLILRGMASTAPNAAVIMRRRRQRPLSAPCSGLANMWKVSPPILLKNAGLYAAAKTEKKKKPAKASADGPPD